MPPAPNALHLLRARRVPPTGPWGDADSSSEVSDDKEKGLARSTRHPALSQRPPANQRTAERQKRLVDVGPLVVADAQAAKLVEPGKCPLDYPPPPAQATPVLGAAHRQPGHDVPRSETAPNRSGVVAAITKHTVRTPPRSPAFALERGNRIHQRQGLLRVIPVRAGEADGEGHATSIAYQMTLAPAFGPIGGIRPGLIATKHRAHGTTIHDGSRPIDLVVASQPIQQRKVDQIPYAQPLSVVQAPPAGHPRSAAEFLRQHLPGNATAKDEDNAGETRAIRDAWPSTLGSWW
jgi:hypothetical protein